MVGNSVYNTLAEEILIIVKLLGSIGLTLGLAYQKFLEFLKQCNNINLPSLGYCYHTSENFRDNSI